MNNKIRSLIENKVLDQSPEFKKLYQDSTLEMKISSAWYNTFDVEKCCYTLLPFFYKDGYPVKSFFITEGLYSKRLAIWDVTPMATDINRCPDFWAWVELSK